MTPNEITMARALSQCTFVPGIGSKRFAKSMAHLADSQPNSMITPGQHKYLCQLVIRFRRQIDPNVVSIAKQEMPE